MAKIEKRRKSTSAKETDLIPERYQHLAAVLVLLASLVIFFHEFVFDGKVFNAVDTIAAKSFQTLVEDARLQGTAPLWNPYIFCGMPAVASMSVAPERVFDITAYVMVQTSNLFSILMINKDVGWVLFFYFVMACGVYLLAYSKLKSKIVALLVALATLYSMYIIIWIMVSHITKIAVMAFFPYMFYFADRLREKFHLWLALLFVIIIHFLTQPAHIQMIFYTYFALGIYYLVFLVRAIVKKENWMGVIRSGAILAVASGLAFMMTADQYLSTLEYSKYSMRGSGPVQAQQSVQGRPETKVASGGLDYDYATSWSFSPGEMLTFAIPSAYGFGWFEYKGALTARPTRLNTYFGPQPFTDAPQYMGIVILVLALVGAVKKRKDPFVQYLIGISILALFISFGKELSFLYDLMFNHFPLFNKFRIPSMILVLVQFSIPMLAGYGLISLLALRESSLTPDGEKRWKIGLGVVGALAFLSLIGRSVVESLYASFFTQQEVMTVLSRSIGRLQPAVANEFYSIITGAVATDVAVGLILLGITFAAIWLYVQRKITLSMLGAVMIVVVLMDLWRVDMKPMEPQDKQQAHQENFAKPEYVKFLLQDTTLYRTLEFVNGQPPYSNTLAYWRIQSAYGYQGAKMRAFQDIVENVGLANPLVWGLMNVRYILSNTADSGAYLQPVYRGADRAIYYNRAELPRAFFVNSYKVATGMEIMNHMKEMSFNPRDVAYVLEDPQKSVDPVGAGAAVRYTSFNLHRLELVATATGHNLLFLSEVYYPEGWKAFIDGTETPIYRLNYLFRGVIVPPGQHTVTMTFVPKGYFTGKTASLAVNLLVIGCLIGMGVVMKIREKKTPPTVG